MQVQPYLFFDGRCDEAIEFYKKAVGAKVENADAFQGRAGPVHDHAAASRTRSCMPQVHDRRHATS